MNSLLNQIEKLFEEDDEKITQNNIVYHLNKRKELDFFKQSEEYRAIRSKNYQDVYQKMFNICGGKTWYQLYNGNPDQYIVDFVVKNQRAGFAKRNAKIAQKLAEINVLKLESIEVVSHDGQGFDIVVRIMTDDGLKILRIETIYAGGYNIQCLHRRTIVKLR